MLFCWLGQTPDKTSINQISFSEDHLYFKYLLNLFTNNLINLKHYYAEILCLILLLNCFLTIHHHYHLLRNFPCLVFDWKVFIFISQILGILFRILRVVAWVSACLTNCDGSKTTRDWTFSCKSSITYYNVKKIILYPTLQNM